MAKSVMNVFLLLVLVSFFHGVTGRIITSGALKNARKTIKSEDGDIIDCVDMHKQSSLHHPLLKDHTVQMSPSRIPSLEIERTSKKELQQLWHKSGSCPEGTIPILRSTENVKKLMDSDSNGDVSNQTMLDYSANDINAAVGYVYDVREGPFYGGKALMSIWNLFVENGEYSKNYILAADCKGDNSTTLDDMDVLNFVAAGWIVDCNTFGDNHPRLYVEWRAGSVGCYNTLCPGFVQVSNNIALGSTFTHVSVYNDPQQLYSLDVHIRQDTDSGHWWVDFGGEMVGYWPKDIFNDFSQASAIVFGGEVLNKARNGGHTRTQMGSGHIPSDTEKYGRAGDVEEITVRKFDNNYYNIPLKNLVTSPLCYSYLPSNDATEDSSTFYYGGPGGASCDRTT